MFFSFLVLFLLELAVTMSEHDDDALWRSVVDNRSPVLTEADSFETMVRNLAPYTDYGHAMIASEGQGADSSTSRDGAAGSRDNDPPTTMGQQFADAVCHRESLRSQTVKDAITVLTNKRISRDTKGGPRVSSALMKKEMCEYGAACGNAMHITVVVLMHFARMLSP